MGSFTHICGCQKGGVNPVILTVKEMEMLCVMHSGTLSATIDMLSKAENEPPERMAVVQSLIEKLSSLKDGETVSLAFDPAK